ncbi:MAG: phosphatase PAP2 family protein [Gemmatimonadaceae bacterium]
MLQLARLVLIALWSVGIASLAGAQPASGTSVATADTAPGRLQWYDLGVYGRFGYTQPGVLQSVRNAPRTIGRTVMQAVQRDQLDSWAVVMASTAATIAADEWLLDRTRLLARHVGLPPNHPSVNVRLGGLKLVPVPTTIGSAIYFLGDGAVSLGVAGGFLAVGAWTDDHRATRTASQITESLLAAGTFTQILKHLTGRQTPSESTQPRGKWNWFPSWSEYNDNVPGHDAFPSGHLAVATATVEVIAQNYPEHHLVRPVGYTLLTALSFAMVNNGVHWASDYPLAIALGKSVANVAVRGGRVRDDRRDERRAQLHPFIGPGRLGVSLAFGDAGVR